MVELSDLVRAGEASIAQIVEALNEVDFDSMISDLGDESLGVRRRNTIKQEIEAITRDLYKFEPLIRAGTKNPDDILKGYEDFLFYWDVKGTAKDGMTIAQARHLKSHRSTLKNRKRFQDVDVDEVYETEDRKKYSISEVRSRFAELGNIADSNNFEPVLEAMAMAYRSTRAIPIRSVTEYFGPRWFDVRKVVSSFDRGLKTGDELREPDYSRVIIQQAAISLSYRLANPVGR